MTVHKISNNARIVALLSFICGTGIFVLYYLTDAFSLLFAGLGFIIIAGLVNIIYLSPVLKQLLTTKDNRKSLFITLGLMLINIPVLIVYYWLTTTLLNTMRITFINETSSTLTEIKVFGCEEKHIDKLEPNERKLVWVGITGDCSVNIEFNKDGKLESENVTGYTSANMGQRMTHKIGWENSPANY